MPPKRTEHNRIKRTAFYLPLSVIEIGEKQHSFHYTLLNLQIKEKQSRILPFKPQFTVKRREHRGKMPK
jgi:hypothetical protein